MPWRVCVCVCVSVCVCVCVWCVWCVCVCVSGGGADASEAERACCVCIAKGVVAGIRYSRYDLFGGSGPRVVFVALAERLQCDLIAAQAVELQHLQEAYQQVGLGRMGVFRGRGVAASNTARSCRDCDVGLHQGTMTDVTNETTALLSPFVTCALLTVFWSALAAVLPGST